ncbi:elongation factor G [Teladorsagia circumcincta]|uniref:Elongation factor G n=1 Tax=Teladorsagia circumcincta TaxID=45464 RepID=A0A2G9UEQ0_TELCI|nr:elongation factor G [Teladorsagia circumcincta]
MIVFALRCIVTTASQALGKVHAVLAQRKAKVLNEDINEATGLFEVTALMPVVESFSFCDHLRKNTSGMASAQLEFSHWQLIDEDPYWQPTTQEEMEEYGEKGDSPNHARGYMDAVRRRKGLPTDDVIVVSAEKQRNLTKNK